MQPASPARTAAIVLSGVFLASLDLFIVNLAFPEIGADFAPAGLAELSWILNAYTIVFAALLLPAGRWADRAGRKRVFLTGLAVFVVASALCAAAQDTGTLVAARVVQAAGAALMVPTSLGLLLPAFPPEKRPAVIGMWAAVGGAAAATGPVVGGLLVELSWRWVFLVNVPIGLVALVAGVRALVEIRDGDPTPPDALGAGLSAAAVGALVGGIVQGPEWGWTDPAVLALFAAAVAAGAIVVRRSLTHPAPVLEPEIARVRAFAFAAAGAMLFFVGFAVMLLGSVLWMTGVWGEETLDAGLMLAPGPATAAVFAVVSGALGGRFGPRLVGAAGGIAFALGAMVWATSLGPDPDYAGTLLPGLLIGGVGVGLMLPSLPAAATASLPPARLATGTAAVQASRQVGLALGVALLVAIVGTGADPGAFDGAWALMAAAGVASSLACLAMGPVRGSAPAPVPATLEVAA